MRIEKLGPGVLQVMDDFRKAGLKGLARNVRMIGVIGKDATLKPVRIVVFVHCEESASFDHLVSYGIRFNQSRGKVRTAILPIDQLGDLSDDQSVRRIRTSRYLKPLMDTAPGKVGVSMFKTSSGLTGNGVVVGVIDSGIDSMHPDFLGRILRVWDQTLPGPGVPEGGYGTELTGTDLTISRDFNGHGTHVAGIAAGAGTLFSGIAPAANLVFVKTTMLNANIADAVRYIFRVAHDNGQPAVINLSLGGHADAHDGTDSLSQIIDSECGPGRVVCCAAGNEGNDNIHAQISLGAPATRTSRFHVPANSLEAVWLNGWYPGSSMLQIAIQTPSGFVTDFQSVIPTGDFKKSYFLPDARVDVQTPGPDLDNGDHNFWVVIQGGSPGGPVVGGVWRLRVKNTSAATGTVDIWILSDHESAIFTGASVRDSVKIGSPGCSASAVTVASYTSKVEWVDSGGATEMVGLPIDTISEFSSEGPLRNGNQKPDVTAPGAMITSCFSSDSSALPGFVVSNLYRVMAGTSMATPFITGLVALLLERDPALDPAGVKALLQANSAIPGGGGTFNPKWGFGLINAAGL